MGMIVGLVQVEDVVLVVGQNILDKIVKNGVIVVGYCEFLVLFFYYDNQQKVVGYFQDYFNVIVDVIKKKLNKFDLQVKLILVILQNCILLLQNGIFDFECGLIINNFECQKQVVFFDIIFVVGICLLVKKGGLIKDFLDLKDKVVVVIFGIILEILLYKLNDEKKMNMCIISVKDYGDFFCILESGCVVVFMMDDVLLVGECVKVKKLDNWEIVGILQLKEVYGCMLWKDDLMFKVLVDEIVVQVQIFGEVEKWFDKWFKNLILLKNFNFNFELLDDMKVLFKLFNDKVLN